MSDWSDFDTDVKSRRSVRGPQCGVTLMLEGLPERARASVQQVLDNRGYSNTAIHRALRDRLGDQTPSLFSISNHRRGGCRCGS